MINAKPSATNALSLIPFYIFALSFCCFFFHGCSSVAEADAINLLLGSAGVAIALFIGFYSAHRISKKVEKKDKNQTD